VAGVGVMGSSLSVVTDKDTRLPHFYTIPVIPPGYIKNLKPGDIIFVPSLDAIPILTYPDCRERRFPCVHRVERGVTYLNIAQEFYADTSATELIREANRLRYDPVRVALDPLEVKEGVILVLPVKR
jgi:hypothetical protein